MEIFKGENIVDFFDRYQSDSECLEYLSSIKWGENFECIKCGCKKFTIRKSNFARDCNLCHHLESPTAGTLFHKVKFGIRKAFIIAFEMTNTTKGISAMQLSKRLGISRPTAWLFMQKVRIAMKSSEQYPMKGKVTVDEFVFGGKEDLKQGRSNNSKKKKIAIAVEQDENGGVKRVYFKKISNYSSEELTKIFESHISDSAEIKTDQWTGYKPLKKKYSITQIKSNTTDFFALNTIVHQVKAWLRSVYSYMNEAHIEKYLDEFSFRINRSIHKQTIFHTILNRLMKSEHIGYKQIKISK